MVEHCSAATTTAVAGLPERPYHAFLAGCAGGYVVWGRYSSVNYQILLYLTSRILVGMAKRAGEAWCRDWRKTHPRLFGSATVVGLGSDGSSSDDHHRILNAISNKFYPIAAAAIWGVVMVLFEDSPHVLHRSLRQSMDEIYRFPFLPLPPKPKQPIRSSPRTEAV